MISFKVNLQARRRPAPAPAPAGLACAPIEVEETRRDKAEGVAGQEGWRDDHASQRGVVVVAASTETLRAA